MCEAACEYGSLGFRGSYLVGSEDTSGCNSILDKLCGKGEHLDCKHMNCPNICGSEKTQEDPSGIYNTCNNLQIGQTIYYDCGKDKQPLCNTFKCDNQKCNPWSGQMSQKFTWNGTMSKVNCEISGSEDGGSCKPKSPQWGPYTVQSGDTCNSIAVDLCLDGDYSKEICNATSVCSNLQIGATINYDCTKTKSHCPTPPQWGSYTVKSGDGCWGIAAALCGDGNDYTTEICNAASVCSNLQVGATIKYDCTKPPTHC